jgi:hypothetical protein
LLQQLDWRKKESEKRAVRTCGTSTTPTQGRRNEREREKKADRNDQKNPVSFLLPSPNAARLLGEMNMGTIAYNPDAQDSIRHSKGKTQQNPKNHKKPKTNPKKKKKTTNSCHGMSQTKLVRRTQFLPRRTKTKGGKKKMQFMKRTRTRTRRGSREAREEQEEELLECEALSAASKLFANYCTNQLQIFLCYCLIL